MYDLYYKELPYCCGFDVIGDFGEPNNVTYEDGRNVRDRRAAIAEAKKDIKLYMDRKRGGYIATTVQGQWHAVGALKALGFKPVPGTFAGQGNNRITLWYKRIRS